MPVYFIRAADGTGPVKIGHTGSPPRFRLWQIQCMCPIPLELILAISGDVKLEREIHKRFTDIRLHGEWFAPTDDLLDFIADQDPLPDPPPPPEAPPVASPTTRVVRPLSRSATRFRYPDLTEMEADELTIAEAAAYLKVSVQWVKKLVKSKDLPARRGPGGYYINKEVFGRWIKHPAYL